jgi:hypothetical protein
VITFIDSSFNPEVPEVWLYYSHLQAFRVIIMHKHQTSKKENERKSKLDAFFIS